MLRVQIEAEIRILSRVNTPDLIQKHIDELTEKLVSGHDGLTDYELQLELTIINALQLRVIALRSKKLEEKLTPRIDQLEIKMKNRDLWDTPFSITKDGDVK